MDRREYGALGGLLTAVGLVLVTAFAGSYPLPLVGLALAFAGSALLLGVVASAILDR